EVANLLSWHAEYMASVDFAGATILFRQRGLRLGVGRGGGGTVDADATLSLWKCMVIVYPDGTPRTKHVVTNPIIEVDDAAGTATCRSYYTVLQHTDDLPLQVIAP